MAGNGVNKFSGRGAYSTNSPSSCSNLSPSCIANRFSNDPSRTGLSHQLDPTKN